MSSAKKPVRARTVRGLSTLVCNTDNTEFSPASKHPRITRTSRGLTTGAVSANYLSENVDAVGIYSGRVATIMNSTPIAPEYTVPAVDLISEKVLMSVAVVKPCENFNDSVIDLDASPVSSSSIRIETKEPTPPPSPNNVLPRKSRRVTRAVKNAITKLDKMQKFLDKCAEDNNDSDDVMVVDEVYQSSFKDHSITVKVCSRSGIHRHQMKMRDSFADVICKMAEIENVKVEDIVMFWNNRTVREYDSPLSLQLTVADIIDCHIRGAESLAAIENEDVRPEDPMVVGLVFQTTESKSNKNKLFLRKDEPMEKVMREYCRLNNIDYGCVSFLFDGDCIDSASTPESLDLESDFCIDVITR